MSEILQYRLGNLIKSGKGIYRIYAMSVQEILAFQDIKEQIGSEYGVYSSLNTIYNAINLTEEWLLKAGYKKQNGYGYSNYNVYGTILKNDNGFEFHYYGIIIRLDFVHQLQNLFFSLYGEDLVFSTEP